jgi:SpoVK/Ycf46/Vps4 family AAA+-type ATPase
LKLILKDTKTDPDHFDLDYLTRVMAGMSGSDIKEACRDAAMVPVREFIRAQRERGVSMAGVQAESVRGVRTEDFFGKKGGVQSIKAPGKRSVKGNSAGSSDEYEDVEDSEPMAPSLG